MKLILFVFQMFIWIGIKKKIKKEILIVYVDLVDNQIDVNV